MKNLLLIIFLSFTSNVYATECPFVIKGAQFTFSLENEMHLKISSSLVCNQKLFLPDKLFDSEIEVWKGQLMVAKVYSRKSTYSSAEGKLFLEDATIVNGEKVKAAKYKKVKRLYVNLRRQKIYTNIGEILI